jgi:hypothetical protein
VIVVWRSGEAGAEWESGLVVGVGPSEDFEEGDVDGMTGGCGCWCR